jgi:hypothetical protein
MGVSEDATRGFFAAMKDQPLVLAMVVMNVCLLGFLYYTAAMANADRRHDTDLLYQNRKEVADLLARCTLDKP